MTVPMKKTRKGTLYLLPVTLGPGKVSDVLPALHGVILNSLDLFIVENIRSARRFLKAAGYEGSLDEEHFLLLNEHTLESELPHLLQALIGGKDTGLMSESGIPCVADPGSALVKAAQEAGIRVKPISGPSSIFLALMASGFNGQAFTFHGYLPREGADLIRTIEHLERDVINTGRTHIFIEAPYRNQKLLEILLKTCKPHTNLCIAREITTEQESILTQPIASWKRAVPDVHKKNTIFLLGA